MKIPKPALAGTDDIPFWPRLIESGFPLASDVSQAITATVTNLKSDRVPQITVTEVK